MALLGFRAPAARSDTEDPVLPGDSSPRHLPPSGFGYPPGGFLPSVLDDGPSTAAAPMGFALQGLAPPRQRYPSRGLASPVVLQPARRRVAATPEVGSDGKGARLASARRPRRPNLALLGFRPSKASSSTTFGPASRSCSLMLFSRGCSLRSTPGLSSRGSSVAEAAWSLSRLPAFLGFGTSSNRGVA
jgi:hypothetical protein